MKLVSLAVLAANAIALVNAGNINWKDFDLPSQFMAGGAILNVNKQVNTSGAGGCAVAVAGCLGAALGFCICVAGPQSAVCTASALPGIIGSFFMTTFTQAVYECNQIPLVGITARDIRCTAAKVWMANMHNDMPGNADMAREYKKCFPSTKVPCRTKACQGRH